jgi:hypothetical protein
MNRQWRTILIGAVLLQHCGPAVVARDGKDWDIEVHAVRLPSDFIPSTAPARPLSQDLTVALILPAFDRRQSAFITSSTPFLGWSRDHFDFAKPFAISFPAILRRVFPQAVVVQSVPARGLYDLVMIADLASTNLYDANGYHYGIELQSYLVISDIEGGKVAAIEAKAVGRFDANSWHWRLGDRIRKPGAPALQKVLEQLTEAITHDKSLGAYIEIRKIARALPSDLTTTINFDDSRAYFPNERLDAGETALILIKVKNAGPGQAFSSRLRIRVESPGVSAPKEVALGDLPAGATSEVGVQIEASSALESGVVRFAVDTREVRGWGGRPVVLDLPAAGLSPPLLEIVDVALSDRLEPGADGHLSNGETLEAVVRIRNLGPGPCAGGELGFGSASSSLVFPQPRVPFPDIPVNAVREVRTHIGIPITFAARELKLDLKAIEGRGEAVAHALRSETFKVQLRYPQLELVWRAMDGNSASSSGDRNGVASNGETLEFVFKVVNRGTLAARDVQLEIHAGQEGIESAPALLSLGDLPPLAESAEQRVVARLPRAFGLGSALDRLTFRAVSRLADFKGREEWLSIPFSARSPRLELEIQSEDALISGGSGVIWLEVRNSGNIAAEELRLEIVSENSGLELLDASRVPVRRLEIAVGDLPELSQPPRVAIPVRIRRNLKDRRANLRLRLLQRDFPAIESEASFDLVEEEALVLAAPAEASVPEARRPPVPAPPASISFRRYENGDRVAESRINLRFEVQSQEKLAATRLQHNGRMTMLAPPSRQAVGSGQLWQYDQEIQLEPGTNHFEVVVVTAGGARSERNLSLIREQRQGRVWLAAIGISDYADPAIPDLLFAREDAIAVHDYYRRKFALPQEQTFLLVDQEAKLQNIKRLLGTELAAKANHPDDTVILYFAGHGKREPDSGSADVDGFSKYLLPHDSGHDDLFSTALGMEEITRILQRLQPERVVLVVDSCFSGAAGGRSPFDPDHASWRSTVDDEFLERLASAGRGRVIITASGINQLAFEQLDLGHGIFTYYFLQGLEGKADADRDGLIDVDEVYGYVYQTVLERTGGRQTPMKKAPSQVGAIVIGRGGPRSEGSP